MTALSQAVEDYLTVRRTLGHKLVDHGTLLPDFVAYLEAAGASTVTAELAVAWATQPTGTTRAWWGRRLAAVRGFARHLKAFDPDTEIPSPDLLPYRCRRVSPYLYSESDIAALMAAARALRSPLRAATYETLIGLIATTGMRSGEAVRLDRDDIDWDQGIVTVWYSKFHKSRALPVHSSTLEALERYDRIRDEYVGRPKAPSFFVSTGGTRLNNDDDKTFRGLVRNVGLVSSSGRQPRLHDLRHTFAVRTLLGWYRAGVDVEAHMPLLSTYLGHSAPENTYWYLSAVPELLFLAAAPRTRGEAVVSALAPTLEAYFTERLVHQRQASPNTIAAYRDAWRLLLVFVQQRIGTEPCQLDLGDLDAPLVAAFLEHLETERHNSVRTRNARLAAIRSFFRFAALRHPEHAAVIARVLAIPTKRCERAIVSYLTEPEGDALVASPHNDTWHGRRDHAILAVALQTGLRASELTGLRNQDVELRAGAHLRCWGKGRKERATPLRPRTVSVLLTWMKECAGRPDDPLFPTSRGTPLSRDALAALVAKHTAVAAQRESSLTAKNVTPHVLRHSCAMALLRGGVDRSVLALWLGHEQVETTSMYLHADLSIKERALNRTKPPHVRSGRYRAPDRLLAFLKGL